MTRCDHRFIEVKVRPGRLIANCIGCSISAESPVVDGVDELARWTLIRRIEYLLDRIYVAEPRLSLTHWYAHIYRWNGERLFRANAGLQIFANSV